MASAVILLFIMNVAFSFSLPYRYVKPRSLSMSLLDLGDLDLSTINAPSVDFISMAEATEFYDESLHNYAVFVDVGARHVSDLEEFRLPFWSSFLKKMQKHKKTIEMDKFLYSYDIGVEDECEVAMARLPEHMYQKLDLARKVLETCSPSDNKSLVVSIVGSFGEPQIDLAMYDALYSSIQAIQFTMPTFKKDKGAAEGATDNKNKKKKSESNGKQKVIFVVPDSLLARDSSSCSTKQQPQQFSDFYDNVEDRVDAEVNSAVDNWHYFSNATTNEQVEKKEKIKTLAQTLEANMKKNREAVEGNSRMIEQDEAEKKAASQKCQESVFSGDITSTGITLDQLRRRIERIGYTNHGTNIARALGSLPPNILHPKSYSELLKKISDDMGWKFDQWNTEEMKELGCGAFCAVSQGNIALSGDETELPPDCLIRITYTPNTKLNGKEEASNTSDSKESLDSAPANPLRSSSAFTLGDMFKQDDSKIHKALLNEGDEASKQKGSPIVLVGKGITFDTGGVNVKTANSMKTMKGDMMGSSAALGTLFALSKMEVDYPVECWLAILENNLGPNAMRPDDIIESVTGETIEIVHTDAEGRLILADTLALASRKVRLNKVHGFQDTLSPKCVVDYATLTGTMISSLSNRYIGVMTNKENVFPSIINAGTSCGERLWPFPIDEDYGEDLKSDIADLLQCRQPTEADHIYAAYFLKNFVNPATPWFHFDLASSHRPGGLGHIPSDFTGTGVRASIALLEEFI